jgi:hypothetical protein
MREGKTHDCAFFEPLLALPPDLPPVILDELVGLKFGKWVVDLDRLMRRMSHVGCVEWAM